MIYLFSGLGADERVFRRLDFGSAKTKIVSWKTPKPADDLQSYAQQIVSEQMEDRTDVILIGVSFGGIVAAEVAKIITPCQLILISSIKTRGELPFYYKMIGNLALDEAVFLLSAGKIFHWLKTANFLTYWFFGIRVKEEKQLLKAILRDTDATFLRWAIHHILRWRNQQILENTVHIHGGQDRILPFCTVKNAIHVEKSGHLMIVSQADTINILLKRSLKNLNPIS